jgi:hypothetical protein
MPTPLFESHTKQTIQRAIETYAGRGMEYGDTWRENQFITMKAVARELGLEIPPEFFRALATAGFVDFKYWRGLGGYKDDNIVDSMNYQGFLAQEMKELRARGKGAT